eukprot:s2325_g3.t1
MLLGQIPYYLITLKEAQEAKMSGYTSLPLSKTYQAVPVGGQALSPRVTYPVSHSFVAPGVASMPAGVPSGVPAGVPAGVPVGVPGVPVSVRVPSTVMNAQGPGTKVRTSQDPQVPPGEAMKMLREGNRRFVQGKPLATRTSDGMRLELVDQGQAPHTAVIGCADSRAPVESIFDALPGDIFVLRNAGNTCTHAEGSMIGSLEFCIGKLKSRLVLVLGHTKCGAIYGATKTYLAKKSDPAAATTALDGLLSGLAVVAEKAEYDMGPMADEEFVAAHAVKVNVFHTIDYLLQYSRAIREGVASGNVEIQGAVYDLTTGLVDFMGRSPRQADLLKSDVALPPTVVMMSNAARRGKLGVRTGVDVAPAPEEALELLMQGNYRYVAGEPTSKSTSSPMRKALVKKGQAPHTAVVGCADSRAPLETLFDMMPGELFVIRSMVGSLEFCCGKLGTRLIMVLGHTQCGAIVGATGTYLANIGKPQMKPGSALEGLLADLTGTIKKASDELGPGASKEELAAHAVKVNVFETMNFLLQYSEPLRELMNTGKVDLQGGIYHLETGRVEFLGRSPKHQELLASKGNLPPSMQKEMTRAVRTTDDKPMEPEAALKLMKEGNDRYCHGKPMAGKFDSEMRKALSSIGQAPHTAVVGCADSRVPLELVFDVLPGDLFVMRNAGNTVTHARGSIIGSLEFCVTALRTRFVMVLGHTNCGAIKGATATYLKSKKGEAPEKDGGALEGLLAGLSSVAGDAAAQLGPSASEKEIADLAVSGQGSQWRCPAARGGVRFEYWTCGVAGSKPQAGKHFVELRPSPTPGTSPAASI